MGACAQCGCYGHAAVPTGLVEKTVADVGQNGLLLKDLPEELQSHRDIVLAAVQQDGLALEHAAQGLKADRSVVGAAVKQNGKALEHAADELKADREIVMQATRKDVTALRHAAWELRHSKEFILEQISINGLKVLHQTSLDDLAVSDRHDRLRKALEVLEPETGIVRTICNEQNKVVIRFSPQTARFAHYPDDMVLVWKLVNSLVLMLPECANFVRDEGFATSVLQSLRMLHHCDYDYTDVVVVLAYASALFTKVLQSLAAGDGLAKFTGTEAGHIFVLMLFLGHVIVFDENCPLRCWHKYTCSNYCTLKVLDAALFRLMQMLDFKLRIGAEAERQALRSLLCSAATYTVVISQSAVMEINKQITYFGRISAEQGTPCIASFPGKYPDGWNAVVAERHSFSVACVFLPSAEEGLGQHSPDPDNPGKCFCQKIYGERDFLKFGYLVILKKSYSPEQRAMALANAAATNAVTMEEDANSKARDAALEEARLKWDAAGRVASWGCKWFTRWRTNIQDAVKLKQKLVVYYFEGQVGQGKVKWDDLSSPLTDPWDGTGLGGSQKCEVAFLDKMVQEQGPEYAYDERDVASFIAECGGGSPANLTGGRGL